MPRALLVFALLLAACGPVDPPEWCDGATSYLYAPQPGETVEVLPDDFWTRPADTPTGLQVQLEVEQTAGLPEDSEYLSVYDHLNELDGWGLTAGIVLPFDRTVTSLGPDDVGLVALPDDGPPVRVAADVELIDYGRTALLLPRTPLPPATLSAAAIFTSARGQDGGCVAPSAHLRALLSPQTELDRGEEADPRSPDYVAATAALGRDLDEIAAMVTFTTQSATRLSELVAADISARPAPQPEPMTCGYEPDEGWTECDGVLPVLDYRRADRTMDPLGDGAPLGGHDLPARAWLPGDGTGGPFPTLLYGHGLAHDRSQGTKLARLVVQHGVAVVSVDAVEHGDHPSRTELGIDFLEQLTFFGITFDPPSVDGRLIRDNWRQSTFDKLQLVELLRQGWDLDGDGAVDLDGDRMAYVGLSLGGIMGAELLALTDAFSGALLIVPGGRTTGIIQDSELFSPLIAVMAPEGANEGDIARYFPLLQTLVDPGDAMVWAPRVRADRSGPGEPPQLLVQAAHEDTTMPNSTTDPLVRSFAVPGVGREVWPIADVAFGPGPEPEAGFQQFDLVTGAPGAEPEDADHDNVMTSVEAWDAAWPFLEAVLAGEVAEVVDPYSEQAAR